ncbi:MAG: nucleotidyltransferase domain-containing protein, partial [Candidatus Bathyarchaeota archaeon]|nr:nucleotidyltransferase domain-containing protein [Candidatus Bathyarchaeota archaeon]
MFRVKKPLSKWEFREVVYESDRWSLLQNLRLKALKIMETLNNGGFSPITHGSIARGDVSKSSDVDIVLVDVVPSYKVETLLEAKGFKIYDRIMVQASPKNVVKAYIYLDELTLISFPLVKMTKNEREFYKFGGEIRFEELKKDVRVVGVDKRLMLIEPTEKGHVESSIIGRESKVASILGVGVEIVNERVKVLTRRNNVGRTGVYLKYRLKENEVFEEVLKEISSKNPAIR